MGYTGKSVVVKKFGGYDSLEVGSTLLPPLDDRVQVEVHCCGLNFADLYTRQGLVKKPLPFVLGMECCGVITSVGFESSEYKVGSKVICYNYQGGMYSDIVRVSPAECYVIPDEVSFEDGAALFVNYLTAYFSLIEIGNLRTGQNIFIQSCGGGVGWAAIQLAQTIPDVKIFGTASPAKEETLINNGVHRVLSYDHLDEQIDELCPEGFDLIIETQAGTYREILEKRLKPLGKMVLLGANTAITNEKKLSPITFLKLWWNNKSISPFTLITNNQIIGGLHLGLLADKEQGKVREALGKLVAMLMGRQIKPKIDSIWDLNDVVKATKVLAERRNIGKVLLSITHVDNM